MANKYQQYPAYKKMISAGISKTKILNDIRHSKEAFEGFNISDEMLYVLLARSLNIDVPKPECRRKAVPNNTHIQIADVETTPVDTYVTVKGRIITVFDDEDKVVLNIKDCKNTIRCNLFYESMLVFRNKGYKKGDIITLNNVKIKEYKGRKELISNKHTSIFKEYS